MSDTALSRYPDASERRPLPAVIYAAALLAVAYIGSDRAASAVTPEIAAAIVVAER
jgi:hypothetical protein